ncbi:hypothetical protein DMN91_001532 [Ooceraea biroi]|uniref:Uncharacterized protein n=1 Tax=Ooceraea biroi TaxID=2015173 RepID=A0A3L8DYE9_OOCBI|nr:hypothetical protein DMN91_001532 [Ooceraea biroi]
MEENRTTEETRLIPRMDEAAFGQESDGCRRSPRQQSDWQGEGCSAGLSTNVAASATTPRDDDMARSTDDESEKEKERKLSKVEELTRTLRPVAVMKSNIDEIAASVLEKMAVVDRVARTSNNLKGSNVKVLRDVVREVRVATAVLLERAKDVDKEENRLLRKEIAALKKEMAELRKEVRSPSWKDRIEANTNNIVERRDEQEGGNESVEEGLDRGEGDVGLGHRSFSPVVEGAGIAPPPFVMNEEVIERTIIDRVEKLIDKKVTELLAISGNREEVNVGDEDRKEQDRTQVQRKDKKVTRIAGIPKRIREGRSAAITIQISEESDGATYAEALKKAKGGIDIEKVGINNIRVKKSVTGGRILEIGGERAKEKAEELTSKLREVLEDSRIKVRRIQRKMEVQIWRLDDATTEEEVKKEIAKVGGCLEEDVDCGRIKRTAKGLGSL